MGLGDRHNDPAAHAGLRLGQAENAAPAMVTIHSWSPFSSHWVMCQQKQHEFVDTSHLLSIIYPCLATRHLKTAFNEDDGHAYI